MGSQAKRFDQFYTEVFLPEHLRPMNIALHVAGTAGSWVGVALAFGLPNFWLLLLFPVLNAAPGLLGHRLFERNVAVGDLRITRTDYPGLWFLAGNHRMVWDLVRHGFHWRTDIQVHQ